MNEVIVHIKETNETNKKLETQSDATFHSSDYLENIF